MTKKPEKLEKSGDMVSRFLIWLSKKQPKIKPKPHKNKKIVLEIP
jgi:hypothetical protein